MENLTLDKLFVIPENADRELYHTYVGIDFGTSTTVVSIASINPDTKAIVCKTAQLRQPLPDDPKAKFELMPTVIAKKDGKLYVGTGAAQMKHKPDFVFGDNIWHSFKMELGKDMGPKYYRSESSLIKSPQDATKVFFKYLKQQIEEYCTKEDLSSSIKYAVSVPASFESNQRKDLLDALAANGIAVSGGNLIDEPNAAFLGYINQDYTYKEPILLSSEYSPKVLVFDFGAGTCDISILEIGVNYNGYYSRNISISQFEELGGNDIDRYIAYNYLLPGILKQNNVKSNLYTQKQKDVIAEQLLGVAERLKIKVCENLAYIKGDIESMRQVLESDASVIVKESVKIYTEYGDLEQDEFSLLYRDFHYLMKVFLNKDTDKAKKISRQKEYNNIYTAIKSALEKARVEKGEVDYVMMIGGSSKNPFVQKALRSYFPSNVRFLFPENLQTPVSQGAAIHSLLFNGFNIKIIKPITSEPIFVVNKDQNDTVIIPAGTQIPFPEVSLSNFYIDKPQTVIEMPLCVSKRNKKLGNLIFRKPDGSSFNADAQITLYFEMTGDKLLKCRAVCEGVECSAVMENPFVNAELTVEERAILAAERKTYISAADNKGIPSKQSLIDLREAYVDAERDMDAAETYEEQIRYYPDESLFNYIGVLYHNSGNYYKAIQYFEMALKYDPDDSHAHSNLGHSLYLIGKNQEAIPHLERAIELEANTSAMIVLGEIHRDDDDMDKCDELFQQAYNILYRKWKDGSIKNFQYSWLSRLADDLGKHDIANEVRASKPTRAGESWFNDENLTKTKQQKQ